MHSFQYKQRLSATPGFRTDIMIGFPAKFCFLKMVVDTNDEGKTYYSEIAAHFDPGNIASGEK